MIAFTKEKIAPYIMIIEDQTQGKEYSFFDIEQFDVAFETLIRTAFIFNSHYEFDRCLYNRHYTFWRSMDRRIIVRTSVKV